MGQAKLRGDFEKRKALAIEANTKKAETKAILARRLQQRRGKSSLITLMALAIAMGVKNE